jgi:adenylate cyclase
MPRKTPKSDASPPPAAAVVPAVLPEAKGASGHSHAHLPHFDGLLQKIKQRNVGRVAILYIVVSYLILEPFEMFFHLLDLPVWTGRTAVALVVLGFPVALFFAWIYEVTPTGLKPSAEVDPQQSIARQTGRKLDYAIISVLAVALVYFVADKFWFSKHVAVVTSTATVGPVAVSVPIVPLIPEKSVAVLPFVDMSEKKDQEYFSDGLSEELIDMLTKVPDLRVPARTSSFYFKGKQTTIADIAKMLSVAHVLEGSVRKSGNKLRVTAQLIRVDTGYHLWSQTFDRDAGDIFRIQDDISNAVVGALKVSLGTLATPHSKGTSNEDAYDLYLLAKSNYDGANSKDDFQKIVDQLNEAIRLDPSFGRAWALLSGTLSAMGGFGFIDPTTAFNDARSAALKGIALSPKEPDGHRVLAKVLYLHDWDWERADSEMYQALSLAPDDPANLTAASIVASILGRANVAAEYSTRAVLKDPLSSVSWDQLGEDQMYAGNLAEAVAALRQAQELNPAYPNAHWNLGVALLVSGKPTEALAEFERDPDDDDRSAGRALVYPSLGRTAAADSALRQFEAAAAKAGEGSAYVTAAIHAYRGERDQAFAWLDRAYQRRAPDCSTVKLDPLLRNLRTDPRFKAFLRKMKLPE